MQAGWARVDITPPLGARLRGYFHERRADAVHDPLWAKALWLADGDQALCLVACDLCSIDLGTVTAARRLVHGRTGIAAERVIVHATHSHLGPITEDHSEQLAHGIAAAAGAAQAAAGPVTARAGTAHDATHAFCRRFVMRDGTVRMNPGRGNPDIVCPTTPVDDELGLLELTVGERTLLVINYALHLDTIGGTAMSADWPHFLEQRLRERRGEAFETIFLQGCAGEINHLDVTADDAPTGFDMAAGIGATLAEVIAPAELRPIELARLGFDRAVLELELPRHEPAAVAAARAIWAGDDRRFTRELVEAGIVLQQAERGPSMTVEVTAARLGPVGLVAVPGELFCEYGRRLKRWSPFQPTLIAELCHDDIAYVPTPEGKVAGGYESWNNLTPPGTGDRMMAAAADRLHRLAG